jgi:hypothetical protein
MFIGRVWFNLLAVLPIKGKGRHNGIMGGSARGGLE